MLRTIARTGRWALCALAIQALPSCCKTNESEGCKSDVDCKGDRVCENGQCVEGKASPGPGTATALPEPKSAADPARTVEVPPSPAGTPGQFRSVSHMGEELYFIVGGTYSGMREAQQDYERRKGAFGDMQDYFVVRRTDDLKGMRPGFWIVAEAHRCKPNEETQMFAKRAFPQAYVKRATPTTPEPLPVYEDNVPSAPCNQ